MDKKARKGALGRKMDQSYQPDPSEQEKNYDSTNGLEGAQGDSDPSISEDTQKGGPEGSPMEEAGESPKDEMTELAQGVEEIMNSKTTDPKTKAIVGKLMEMLAGGAQPGAPTGPTPPGQEDGQLASQKGGSPVTSMSM